MQIKKIDIYGYGKWVDQSFELNEGLQFFLGENEAGKSTLMSFIHSILFGFPTRNSTFLRYEPKESSKYGGKIIAEDSLFGELIIERVHGKVTGDVTVTLEDGTTGSDKLLEKVLKGLSRENFQSIFSFSLNDIENVHQLDKNKLSRYLLNIGAHSTDYYLDLVDEFQKSAYDLYRPSGRIPPLNKELTGLEEQEQKLDKLEKRNESYLDLIKKQDEQNDLLKKIEEEENDLQDKLTYLKEFKKELHVLREIQSLEKEISETQLPFLKEDGPYLLEEYQKVLIKRDELFEEVKTNIGIEKEKFLKPELIETYHENKKEISILEQNLPEMIEELGHLQTLESRIKEEDARLLELKRLLKIKNQDNLPNPFSAEEKLKLTDWQESYSQFAPSIESLKIEIQELEYKLSLKNQKADQYEELMWDNQYFKEIENKISLNNDPKLTKEKSKAKLLPIGFGIIGMIILIASFITSFFNQWLVVGVGVFVLMISFLLYRKVDKSEVKTAVESQRSENLLINEYEKQLRIKSDWQILLGEIDVIQVSYQAKTEEKIEKLNEQDALTENWQKLLISHNLSTVHFLENAEEIIVQTNELKVLEELKKDLTERKTSLTDKLANQMTRIDDIISINEDLSLVEKMKDFRLYLRELNQLLETEQSKLDQLNKLKQKETELIKEKQDAKSKVNHLLETSGVETQDEFVELYKKKDRLDGIKSRVQFLKENAPSFDSNKKLPSKEELLEKEEKLTHQLEEQDKKGKEIINKRASIQVNIKNIEKDGSYSEALQDFENQKASTQYLTDEWVSDKIAAAIIQSTLNQVTKERFEEIITEINRYFSLLTDGEYENILFKNEDLFVQKKEGTVMEVKALSRGTAEPLYVAIRLAYIVKMQDIIKLPIIIDDPFVNFDQKRKRNVYRLLEQLSDKLQIIYFSFDSDIKEEFEESQIIELENYK